MTKPAAAPASGGTLAAEWEHEGLVLQARIESGHVTLETRVRRVRGSFSLGYRDEDEPPSDEAWTEIERVVRLSAHCILESDKAHDEPARFFALPPEVQACMVDLCETQRIGYIHFEDEILSLYLGMTSDGLGVESCVELVPTLAMIARALPSAFKSAPDAVARRFECGHCRHVVFLLDSETSCSRCGANASERPSAPVPTRVSGPPLGDVFSDPQRLRTKP